MTLTILMQRENRKPTTMHAVRAGPGAARFRPWRWTQHSAAAIVPPTVSMISSWSPSFQAAAFQWQRNARPASGPMRLRQGGCRRPRRRAHTHAVHQRCRPLRSDPSIKAESVRSDAVLHELGLALGSYGDNRYQSESSDCRRYPIGHVCGQAAARADGRRPAFIGQRNRQPVVTGPRRRAVSTSVWPVPWPWLVARCC